MNREILLQLALSMTPKLSCYIGCYYAISHLMNLVGAPLAMSYKNGYKVVVVVAVVVVVVVVDDDDNDDDLEKGFSMEIISKF